MKGERGLVGVKIAVVLVYENLPGTNELPCMMVKVEAGVLRVSESIGTLKVAIMILFSNTSTALFAGSVVTVGGASVLKVHT